MVLCLLRPDINTETETAGQQFASLPAEPQSPLQDEQMQVDPAHTQTTFTEALSDQFPENYYEETHAEETPAQYLQPLDPQDQIPALFHRDESHLNKSNKIPITKALYGLTGAIIVGAASVFFILPEPQTGNSDAKKFIAAQSANRLFPKDEATDFSSGNLTLGDRNTVSFGVKGDSWEKGPAGNLLDNSNTSAAGREAKIQPEIFASINGPIERLVSNAVKDLSALGSQKRDTFGHKDALSFDQTQAPAKTLNQLEASLENIVNAASGQFTNPNPQIILAQKTIKASGKSVGVDKMRTLTDQVVDALSDLNGAENSNGSSLNKSVDHLRSTLSDLVQEAENQGKGVKSVKHLLEEALGKNQKNLPAALKNKDGSLDISTLIASVVKRSDGTTRTSSADADYLALIEDEGQKTALTSRIITQKGKGRYLIVKAGDTLSSIAYASYGDAFAYPKIFNANKTIINNPNSLAIGMRLTIPK